MKKREFLKKYKQSMNEINIVATNIIWEHTEPTKGTCTLFASLLIIQSFKFCDFSVFYILENIEFIIESIWHNNVAWVVTITY